MIAAINGLSPSVDPNRFFIQGGKLIPNVLKLLKAK